MLRQWMKIEKFLYSWLETFLQYIFLLKNQFIRADTFYEAFLFLMKFQQGSFLGLK